MFSTGKNMVPTVDDFKETGAMLDINRITLEDGDPGCSHIRDTSNLEGNDTSNLEGNEQASKDSLSTNKNVGSLAFSVIDASTTKYVSKVPKVSNAGTVKSMPRAKVPYEKGYCQMDWMKLTRLSSDLAGLKGESNKRLISMVEVKENQSDGAMWTVLKGKVYNLYAYMKFHPGGVDMLMKAVGKDCTSLFNKYHAWVNAEFLLEKCLVGTLDDAPPKDDDAP